MIRKLIYLLFCISAVFICGCGSSSEGDGEKALCYEKGPAAIYDISENGTITSSKERYERSAMTASHANLPYGTTIKVTNLSNGRSVSLRINDHNMPEDKGFILKVSEKAASELALTSGQEVSIDIIRF